MLRLAAERDTVPVVADQWGNPTSAFDIADGICAVAQQLLKRGGDGPYGVYHLAGTGATHWAGFASHVFQASSGFGGPSALVREIPTADYPTKAKRPRNSRLATGKLREAFGWQAPEWKTSCTEAVRLLLNAQ
jgi:dTDP-4-dehydrorhamnose reductase